MFASKEDALSSPMGDVILVQDMNTGLVYNREFRTESVEYGQDYQNEQACSSVFIEHLQAVTNLIRQHFTGKSVIEVGCGKGYFLEHLLNEGFSVTGVDPAYEGTNPNVVNSVYAPDIGLKGDCIVLRHVLEHIADPVAFLTSVLETNGKKGIVYIEVPSFEWICRHGAWFDIYYEHVNYFSLYDFHSMFGIVHDIRYIFNGQYIAVVADLASLRMPVYSDSCRAEIPEDFSSSMKKCIDLLNTRNSSGNNKGFGIWGGASKGTMFSLFMQRAGLYTGKVIDINPAKQGKYLPCSGLRVYSPEEALLELDPDSVIFVMNSNYLEEVKHRTGNLHECIQIDNELQ